MDKKVTFFNALRDLLVAHLPFNQLPPWLIRLLYGFNPDFIFLGHLRDIKDLYDMIPFSNILRRFLSDKVILRIATFWPAGIVTHVKWGEKMQGFIVAIPILPEALFAKRENTIKAMNKIVKFIRKISYKKVYVGLAAWWPMVTNNGLAFKRVLKENDRIVVTNGHTATLLSIYFTINKISSLVDMPLNEMKIAVIGIGKMGTAVVEILNNKVKALGFFDKNGIRLNFIEKKIKTKQSHTAISKHFVANKQFSEKDILALSRYHIAVCTTSNIDFIINNVNLLSDILVIDDSRPEAFPRIVDIKKKIVVLEGGLIKFKDIKVGVDFGFGKKDNVFGCMAEAIILAMNKERQIRPTLGDVDFDNFEKMSNFCKENDISEGDLKSGQRNINNEILSKVLK